MSRPTPQQVMAMADFLDANPGIAKGFMRTAHGKSQTKNKWEEISTTLNALGGAIKDGKGWAKYWSDKKCSLKKTCAQHAQSLNRTGGGPPDIVGLTIMEQRLIALMGGPQFAFGDGHVAINPFGSMAAPTSEMNQEVWQQVVPECPSSSPVQVEDTGRVHTSPESPSRRRRLRQRSPLRRAFPQRERTRSGRALYNSDRDRYAAIEAKRVEAEATTARALAQAVDSMGNLTAAIDGLAKATKEGAEAIAVAISNIAACIMLRPKQ